MLDGEDDTLSSLAIERIIKMRTGAESTSVELLDYLASKLSRPGWGSDGVSDPRNVLRRLISQELAIAVLADSLAPECVVEMFGAEEFFRLVWLVRRQVRLRDRSEDILQVFAQYSFDELIRRFDELRESGLMRPALQLVTHSIDSNQVTESLSRTISDYEDLLKLAEGFVSFNEWHGNGVRYEMYLDSKGLLTVISPDVIASFSRQIESEQGRVRYDNSELISFEVSAETKRAFTVDALAEVLRKHLPGNGSDE